MGMGAPTWISSRSHGRRHGPGAFGPGAVGFPAVGHHLPMDQPPPGISDGQPPSRRLTRRRRAALAFLVPLAVVAGGAGVYVASRSGLIGLPPAASVPPGMTPSPLVGPSGPLPTAAAANPPASAGPSGAALPTLVPPGSSAPTAAPPTTLATPLPTPSGTPAPPPSIQPPPTPFTDQGTYRGDLQATGGDVAVETLAKFAGPKSILATASSLTFTSADTWIPVSGTLGPNGTFTATGTGAYAGVTGVRVQFEGRITAQLLVGSYEVGVGGGLPGGVSVTYQFSGARIDPPPQPIPDAIGSFLATYAAAIRAGDADTLVALLHPLVIQRYGADQCRTALAAEAADPTFALEATGVTGPGTWLYTADGASIAVHDVYTIAATVTAIGVVDQRFLHFGWVDGGLRWFADCGTPIG